MATMQAFHKMLNITPKRRDRRLDALVAITRADRNQLSKLSSDLVWQTWSADRPAGN